MDALTTRAPAKVNLVLAVGPLRPDGYHDIESLMVPLSLADEVTIRVRRDGEVTCRAPGRPDLDGPSNLAARAAEAFRRRTGVHHGCDITVAKRIPVTAGLGGGSSDAAAVLRLLARAHSVRDRALLADAALEVGSDVPFFLGPGPAWAKGRGERLAPADVAPIHLVLAYPRDPAFAIRAGDAYRWLDERRAAAAEGGSRADRARTARSGSLELVSRRVRSAPFTPRQLRNDLEPACLDRFPALAGIRARLEEAGARAAMMSGSGPTVFGVFASGAAARGAAIAIGGELEGAWEVHLARTLRRHPGVSRWKSPRSASFPSRKTGSRRT